MAMELQGRKPTSTAGKLFRAEFWAWRPIHALIGRLCSDLVDDRMLQAMTFGGGAGPVDPEICREMADRFQRFAEQHAEGYVLDAGIRVTPEGRFVTEQELADNASLETVSPYEVGTEQLNRWIEFLRDCGGFEVW
ncbi:MAG TPA: hypothetical protein VL475_01760 [Planctomycetaceae bacterium]|nr:hypothetical protein [Planctomycetaceae bacterium]